jgi:hypothetical protein
VCIDKPITLVGVGPAPVTLQVAGSYGYAGLPGEVAVIHVASGVQGTVGFRNLHVLGAALFHDGLSEGATGIRCESAAATLVLDHCIVQGCDYPFASKYAYSGRGAPAVSGAVSSLVAVDSELHGGDAVATHLLMGSDGAHGIDVAGQVVLVRSISSGGAGSDTVGYPDCAFPGPPGDGGHAVVASQLQAWSASGAGGDAGEALDCSGAPIGAGTPGLGIGPNPPATLQVTQQPVLGGVAWFRFDNPAAAPVVLGIGLQGWGTGIVVPALGPVFVGPAPILIASPWGIGSLGLPVPSDPVLLGLHFPVQALVGAALTNPDSAAILL